MATEERVGRPESDDQPQLLVKLQERKARHKERGLLHRAGVVVLGCALVVAGVVMSGPGVPGPGIATILLGLGFLALEFDRAERLLERAIVWGDRALDRAERAPRWQKAATAALGAVVLAACVAAVLLWDIPLVPVV